MSECKYKILTSTASADSAMKLRDAIEKIAGLPEKTVLVSKSSKSCVGFPVLLRYGCGYGKLDVEPDWGNPEFTNKFCIDKLQFSALLANSGVVVPQFHSNILPTEYPVLVRETLTGAKSEGINVVHNAEEFLNVWTIGFWWTKYFKHDMELRVYIVLSEKGFTLSDVIVSQ